MSSTPIVALQRLSKSYVVPVREAGIAAAVKSLFDRRTRLVEAVREISFEIYPGEVVGFLGPNGAGKTTTLKMLSGLLHPSGGDAAVMGFRPWRREREFLQRITLVMGQRNQLMWDIPVVDSFDRNRVVYRLSKEDYRSRVDELTELLELAPLLNKPVRTLSLGERMKCEIAAALLHHPRVLYLDEPTLGLDVTMQRRLRAFIGDYNRRTGATVLLTSHYMADVEALCPRVIVVHRGAILFDGALGDLVARATAHKTLVVEVDDGAIDWARFGEVIARDGGRITLRVAKADTARITGEILGQMTVRDLTVMDPPIDEVIDRIFTDG